MESRKIPMRKQRLFTKGYCFCYTFFYFFPQWLPTSYEHSRLFLIINRLDISHFLFKITFFSATSFTGLISGGGQAEANRRRNH